MIRKSVSLVFLILSVVTLIVYYLSLNVLSQTLSTIMPLSDAIELFNQAPPEEKIMILGILLHGFYSVFGIPILIFIVSLIGLTLPSKRR